MPKQSLFQLKQVPQLQLHVVEGLVFGSCTPTIDDHLEPQVLQMLALGFASGADIWSVGGVYALAF